MCGIFGVTLGKDTKFTHQLLKNTVNNLFVLSESRGKEASGIFFLNNGRCNIYKEPLRARYLMRRKEYARLFKDVTTPNTYPITVIGHTRLATNGPPMADNNCPITCGNVVGVHNGIIVNDDSLWKAFSSLKRKGLVDSEIIFSLLNFFIENGLSLTESVQAVFRNIQGSASIAAFVSNQNSIVLATNTGSLYSCRNSACNVQIFASELPTLQKIVQKLKLVRFIGQYNISQIKPGCGCLIHRDNVTQEEFKLDSTLEPLNKNTAITWGYSQYNGGLDIGERKIALRRCTRCILPETMPFIKFNTEGVCNYCLNYKKIKVKGEEALEKLVAPYRSNNCKPDCVLSFSGGRDSSYGLHYLKKVLKMNPIAFTYDWGMVADIGRRNQARMVSKLGVEQVIISADINKRREYIRKNILAWLKRPHLGMVPIFMAGDKMVEYYVGKVAKKYGIKLIILCRGNELETSEYKFGFSGVKNSEPNGVMHEMPLLSRIKLLWTGAWQYFLNPSYINSSLLDNLFAYYVTCMMRFNFIYLWHYVKWDEEKIVFTLKKEYDWETEKDTMLSWRTDDGTAPFYNYIYVTVAGFTENDAFRSNQIREGILIRSEAIRIIEQENQPRYEAIRDYLNKVGLDYKEVMRRINAIPKLYDELNFK